MFGGVVGRGADRHRFRLALFLERRKKVETPRQTQTIQSPQAAMAKQRASQRKSNPASKSTRREKSLLNSTGAFSSNAFASKPESAPEPKPTVPELIASATVLLHEQNDTHKALALVTLALTQAPASLPALELLAEIHIELGDEDTARAIFEKAVELDPQGERSGPEKFLWLAQLGQGGEDMMRWYTRGVEVLRRWMQTRDAAKGGKPDERDLDGKLCSALCAMAEIYMTDLWSVSLPITPPPWE